MLNPIGHQQSFPSRRSFFGMKTLILDTYTNTSVDTTDLDIPSQIKGFDRQSGGPPWKSPFSSMSLSMMAREVADMRMGASKPCLIVFRCSTFAHHFLKTKNCWKQMLTLVVGNLAPKSSSPLKLSSGFPHSSQRGKLKYIPILPMPIGVEDYKKSIKHTIVIFLMLLIVF